MRRRVRRDTTPSLGGVDYEVPLGYLAGQIVTVATSLFDSKEPALELDGKTIPLTIVDPLGNSKKRRPPKKPAPDRPTQPVDFNPGRTLLAEEEEEDEEEDNLNGDIL